MRERSIYEVFLQDPNTRKLVNCDETFDFVYAYFTPKAKLLYDPKIIDPCMKYNVGSQDYYEYYVTNGSRYWETDILTIFGRLQTISSNND